MKHPPLSPILSPLIPIRHGFFRRIGGKSQRQYHSLNTSYFVGDDPCDVAVNRSRIAQFFAIHEMPRIFIPHQIHSNRVCTITHPHQWHEDPQTHPRADALVTSHPNIAIGITSADCVPILLVDPKNHVVAAIHGGWRGILDGIILETILAMKKIGAESQHIIAAIGPCIDTKSYPVGQDLIDKLSEKERKFVQIFQQKTHLNLTALTQFHLLCCQVHLEKICLQAHIDTYQNPNDFFSSRRCLHQQTPHLSHQKRYGCQAAVISLISPPS